MIRGIYKQISRVVGKVLLASILLGVFSPVVVSADVVQGVSNATHTFCFQDLLKSQPICASTLQECIAAADEYFSSPAATAKWGAGAGNMALQAKRTCNKPNSVQVAQQVQQAVAETNNPSSSSKALGWLLDATVGNVLKGIAWLFFWIAGQFLTLASFVLNLAIEKTISPDVYSSLTVVNNAWLIIRDLSNLLFIFILLYIAIATILDIGGRSLKQLLVGVILSALLINFSLFFGQVIIDVGNIFAKQFWVKITDGGVRKAGDSLIGGGKIQTLLNPEKAGKGVTENYEYAIVYVGGGIVMFVLGYVMFAGAIMMAIRMITLILLLIFSPFAFLGLALPKYSYFDSWMGDMLKNTLTAPIFLIMLYIVTFIINSGDLSNMSNSRGGSLSGTFVSPSPTDGGAIFFNYLLLIMLILTTIKVTSSIGGKGMETGQKLGKWITGGYVGGVIAGGAIGARFAGKKVGAMVSDKKMLQDVAGGSKKTGIRLIDSALQRSAQGMLKVHDAAEGKVSTGVGVLDWAAKKTAKGAINAGNAAQVGSWDLRRAKGPLGLKLGEMAAGALASKTGVSVSPEWSKQLNAVEAKAKKDKKAEDKRKQIISEAAALHPTDYAKQKAYVESRLAGETDEIDEVSGLRPDGTPIFRKKQIQKIDSKAWKKDLKEVTEKITQGEAKKVLQAVEFALKPENQHGIPPAVLDQLVKHHIDEGGNKVYEGKMTDAAAQNVKSSLKTLDPTLVAGLGDGILSHPEFINQFSATHLRAISQNQEVKEETIQKIYEDIMNRAKEVYDEGRGGDPRVDVPGFSFLLDARPESRWYRDPKEKNDWNEKLKNFRRRNPEEEQAEEDRARQEAGRRQNEENRQRQERWRQRRGGGRP